MAATEVAVPLETRSLAALLLSKLINDLLKKPGHFWFKNYYDKGIRDQAHFDCVYRYIENNPLTLSISQQAMRFYGIYGSD